MSYHPRRSHDYGEAMSDAGGRGDNYAARWIRVNRPQPKRDDHAEAFWRTLPRVVPKQVETDL